ncbi:MAG: hypothetical protein HQL46_15060 [Gammaproteobacteria bacterium]|nr:hypothetical protein [Gammaproteobacteria bacterium]
MRWETLKNISAPTSSDEVESSFLESNSNHTNYFLLKLSKSLANDIKVDYETHDKTATAGKDYISTQGVATIPAGQMVTTIPVTIIGDTITESDETFELWIYNPIGISFPEGKSLIIKNRTILNDD